MTKNKGGRPRIKIDWHIVNSLCEIWCTGEEVASVLGISYDTLNRGCKREFGVGFAEYYKKGSLAGNTSLRRLQWEIAEAGSVPMQIWLGKQYLGQKDKPGDSGGNERDAKFLADLLNGLPN